MFFELITVWMSTCLGFLAWQSLIICFLFNLYDIKVNIKKKIKIFLKNNLLLSLFFLIILLSYSTV